MSKFKGKKPDKRPVATKQDGKQLTGNQWQATPQQQIFIQHYLNPDSDTFSNAYRSALKAGYEREYAKVIASPSVSNQWISEAINKVNMQPEHIKQGIQQIATEGKHDRDKLKAYELLAKLQGLLVQKNLNLNYNIEQAVDELE